MFLDIIQVSWKESKSGWGKFEIHNSGQPVTFKPGSQYSLTQAYLHICNFMSLKQKFDLIFNNFIGICRGPHLRWRNLSL